MDSNPGFAVKIDGDGAEKGHLAPLELSWEDVSLSVDAKGVDGKKASKTIIHSLSGSVKSGQVLGEFSAANDSPSPDDSAETRAHALVSRLCQRFSVLAAAEKRLS